ncbi:unnamed protein product [Camellia sinensis]
MGFEDVVGGRWTTRYKRLTSSDREKVAVRPRRRWVTRMNGKLKGFRLPQSKRLNWKAFSIVMLPRRMAQICAEVVNRMKTDEICPAIIFSGQWGLPVLSHSNVKCRSAIYFH